MPAQTTIDFDRTERAARRTVEALAELGVPQLQRSVVYLLLAHPDSRPHTTSRLVYRLPLTWRAALAWLHDTYLPPAAGRSHSSIRKALAAWSSRGIMHAAEGVLWLHGERLRAWYDEAIAARREIADPFDELPAQSATPSRLPRLPLDVFGSIGLGPMVELVREWWRKVELTRDVVDPDELIGAIIAARRAEPHDPQKYVEACLARGVKAGLVVQARKLRHCGSSDQTHELSPASELFRQQQLAESQKLLARRKG